MEEKTLKGRSFLTLTDYSAYDIRYFLDLATLLKARRASGEKGDLFRGRNILLLFEKPSTRTRCAFEMSAAEEGAAVTYIAPGVSQFGKKESLADSARVFGRYYDGIAYRGFKQSTAEGLANFSGVPVWNALTDEDHPTQVLADILTIEEKLDKPLSEIKIVFCGDTRNNMCYAWMYGCAKLGMRFVGYGPKTLWPEESVLVKAWAIAKSSGAVIEFCDTASCLSGADVVYTDVWVSMGEEDKIKERVRLLEPYRVTTDTLNRTGNDDVLFMHCLPSFHDFETETAAVQRSVGRDIREVEHEVFEGSRSVVFDQAENRLHTIKAVMAATLDLVPELPD